VFDSGTRIAVLVVGVIVDSRCGMRIADLILVDLSLEFG